MYVCRYCGAPLINGYAVCRQCGAPVAPAGPQHQKRSARNPIILSATALVLAAVLVLGLWKPGFFWTLKESLGGTAGISAEDAEMEALLAEKPVYNPSPIPFSGTPAFSLTPAPAITCSAEKNPRDKARP
jgi:hypothetical protein